jgi:protein-S-isoprenylcysteine O-methyltransferase Ste14
MPHNHDHRKLLGTEHPKTHLVHYISIGSFSIVVLIDCLLNFSTGLAAFVWWPIRGVLFAIFLVLGCLLGKWSHDAVFKRDSEDKCLIKTGIFAYIRHPMYYMTHLIFLAIFFLTLSLLSLIPWIISIVMFNYVMAYEEKGLEEMFGEEYINYKKKVHRWIPRLTPAKFEQ